MGSISLKLAAQVPDIACSIFIENILSQSSHLSLHSPDVAARIICYNFSYRPQPLRRDLNPRQSVELHKTGTFEGRSAD